jgi:hypothetical protein
MKVSAYRGTMYRFSSLRAAQSRTYLVHNRGHEAVHGFPRVHRDGGRVRERLVCKRHDPLGGGAPAVHVIAQERAHVGREAEMRPGEFLYTL